MAPSFNSKHHYLAALAIITLSFTACRPASTPAAAEAAEPGMTPSEVILAINRARTLGHLDAIPRSLAPTSAADPVAVILAVDQVLAANIALQHALIDRFGTATAAQFDLSDMGESFGVFSRTVRIVKESIDGDHATVTFQEGDHVPLREVKLERHNNRWLLAPDRAEPGLVEKLQRLARTIDQMGALLNKKGTTLEDLAAAFRLQLWPQLESIAEGK